MKKMNFFGNIVAKTDQKGRVFLPSVFRKELQTAGADQLILRKDIFTNCLVLYPLEVWNREMDKMRSRMNRYDRNQQMVFRQFVADAETVTLDSSGRFLINRRSMEFASIQGSVNFIGMGDTIEIWASEIAENPFMDQSEFGEKLAELMSSPLPTS